LNTATHLIPFSESRNNHPTNGLALCKNHHWHVSKILDLRRSNGGKRIAQTIRAILVAPARLSFQPRCGGAEVAV
jgi:hypothetical protein